MFKRTAVPPVGPSDHQARQPLNMALGLKMGVAARIGTTDTHSPNVLEMSPHGANGANLDFWAN
jgi:hypothetical protein